MIERSTTREQADQTFTHILQCKFNINANFVLMAKLLCQARDGRHWDILPGVETWVQYLDELDISLDKAQKMINIVKNLIVLPFVGDSGAILMTETKCIRLLSMAKKGELTEEFWGVALEDRDIDLRARLGHNVEIEHDRFVDCPRCGNSFPIPKRKDAK